MILCGAFFISPITSKHFHSDDSLQSPTSTSILLDRDMQVLCCKLARCHEHEKALDPLDKLIGGNGSGDWTRTSDTGLMSPLLYRLSYAALEHLFVRPGTLLSIFLDEALVCSFWEL